MSTNPPDDWRTVQRRLRRRDTRDRLRAVVLRPVTVIVVAAVVLLAAAAGITANVMTTPSAATRLRCQAQRAFVPAFFYATGIWQQAATTKPAPSVMILDISGLGAGTAPVAHFQSVVKQEQAAGVTVLGYSSTAFGARPVTQVEADARHYRTWYGVRGIFLDEVRGIAGQLGYYSKIASYVRGTNRSSSIWINPGIYPDQAYMSVASVVMVFEGPYASYRVADVPGWAYKYGANRFADTVYATPSSQVAAAINLSRSRNAGYLYLTDAAGANPYDGLPSYWSREDTAITSGCG